MPYKDPEKRHRCAREWHEAHPTAARDYEREARDRIFVLLGDACHECGLTGPRGFLEVDHINGVGPDDFCSTGRQRAPHSAVRRAHHRGEDITQRFQLLCPNHHRLKTLKERYA